MYRFNDVVILNGLIGDIYMASNNLQGQVVIIVTSVTSQIPRFINDSLLQVA